MTSELEGEQAAIDQQKRTDTDHLVASTVKRIRPYDLVFQYKLLQWRILQFFFELLLVQALY